MAELSLKIDVYSGENIPNEKVAKEISSIFINNYPEMYSQETRESDCNRYKTPEQIQQQIIDGNTWITASLDDKVIGIRKFRLENRSNSTNTKEYLGAWMLVDKPYRELGIGEILLREYLKILSEIKKNTQEQIFAIADVHKENLQSRNLLKKAGYKEEIGKSEDFILARKEII
jgi:RimJ/RimL family protein N-acetyltransferase